MLVNVKVESYSFRDHFIGYLAAKALIFHYDLFPCTKIASVKQIVHEMLVHEYLGVCSCVLSLSPSCFH